MRNCLSIAIAALLSGCDACVQPSSAGAPARNSITAVLDEYISESRLTAGLLYVQQQERQVFLLRTLSSRDELADCVPNMLLHHPGHEVLICFLPGSLQLMAFPATPPEVISELVSALDTALAPTAYAAAVWQIRLMGDSLRVDKKWGDRYRNKTMEQVVPMGS